MKWLLTACLLVFILPGSAQDNLTHVFFANQSRLNITLRPALSGNTTYVTTNKLTFRAHEITHDHSSTIAPGDIINVPEKDHNEANSSLICTRTKAGSNDFTAELEVLHDGEKLFTILVESIDGGGSGRTQFYYNIRYNDGSLENPAPGLLLGDNQGRQAHVATNIDFEGNSYRLVYGVFDENQDNTDNVIYSLSNVTDTIYRYDPPLSDTLNPNVLNVYTYNPGILMPLDISDQDENQRAEVFYKAMPKNMDIIIFQEFFEPSKVRVILEDLAPYYPYQTGRHIRILIPGIGKEGGVRIVSKYPILEEREVSFSENGCEPTDFFSKFANKGVKYAKINKQGQIIHVFGTHTSEQPCDLYIMGQFIAGFDIPKEDIVIMTGDFNVDLNRFDGSEDTYTIMLDTLNALEPTYKSFLNDWEYKGTTSGLNHFYCCNPDGKQHLDYILVSAKHKIPYMLSNRSQQARLNEPDESFGIFDMGDHEPVYARIEFPVLSSTTDAVVSCLGNTVQLDAGPSKPAPGGSFQWYRNEELLPGENNTTLNISLNNAEDFATYTCRHTYEYIPDTSINNFFDYTYMDYRWIFRGVTTGEISAAFSVVPSDSSESCYGVPTLIPVHQGKTPFKIFPNPAHDYIDISGDEMAGYTFEIVDMLGQKMQTGQVTLSGQMARIEIKNFAPGTYFVRGSKNNGRYIAPFIKVQ